jgi:protein disulfide-isomerase A1
LEPVIESLAQVIKSFTPKVKIAKIDGSKNDVDYGGVNIRGYPTIIFYSRRNGVMSPVEYTGDRSVKSILKYLGSYYSDNKAEESL